MNASALLVGMMVGLVGFAVFIYGKRQSRFPHLAAGVVLMAYPYFVDDPAITAGIAVVVLVALWVSVRVGV